VIYSNKYTFSFVIIFIITTILLLTSECKEYLFDAKMYWGYSGIGAIVNGKFSLLNIGYYKRGVLFPTFNFFLILLSTKAHIDPIIIYKVISSLLYSISFCILLPKLIEKIGNKDVKWYEIWLYNIVVLFFWGYYLNYPLTDFICIDFIIMFLYIFYISKLKFIHFFGLGLILGFVVNTRPIYTMLIIGALLLYLYQYRKNIKMIAFSSLVTLAGLYFISLPQLYVNKNILKTNSIFVQTEKLWHENLFLAQLKWGVHMEKYETYLGTTYRTSKVRFLTPGAEYEIPHDSLNNINNIAQFIGLMKQHPIFFINTYTKHFFNGIDIKYRDPYSKNLKTNIVFSICNYIMLFIAAYQLFFYLFSKKIKFRYDLWLLILIFILPAILTVPSAVEVRYFLPIYLVIYMVVVYNIQVIVTYIKEKLLKKPVLGLAVLTVLVGWIAGMNYLSEQTYHRIEFYNDYVKEANM